MATFGDLQNRSYWRLRQRGVNFGGQPGAGATDAMPPYIIQQLLNEGYSEFIGATLEAKIMQSLKLPILTATFDPLYNVAGLPAGAGATASAISLRPLPPQGSFTGTVFTPTIVNPAAMQVDKMTYTTKTGGQNAGYEYGVELCGEQRFEAYSGNFTRRLSWFGPRVLYAARLERKPILDMLPNCASLGDTIRLTVVPDPVNSPLTCACSNGGPMQLLGDIPLIDPDFHNALVEYVVKEAGDAADKGGQVQRASDKWDSYIAKALWKGGVQDGGAPMMMRDIYTNPIQRIY